MNKQRLMVIKAIVRRILEEDPAARDSDEYLYMRVCEEVNPGAVLKR
jgi:hypothetical protein